MIDDGEALIVTLDLQQPVEIGDFVAAFSGLSTQFERYLKTERPDLYGEVKIYVKEVRKGSIEAEIIPVAYNTLISALDHSQIVVNFAKSVASKLNVFSKKGGRLPNTSKTELTAITETIAAVANDPDGKATIRAVRYKKTKASTEFALEFDSRDAKFATQEIAAQYHEITKVTDFDHEKKLLTFFQSNRRDSEKTGEKGVIEEISPKPLAVVYASDLARDRIKSEMLAGDRNVYKLGFFVDVNVSTKAGKPVAYRIKRVREVIELPDDD